VEAVHGVGPASRQAEAGRFSSPEGDKGDIERALISCHVLFQGEGVPPTDSERAGEAMQNCCAGEEARRREGERSLAFAGETMSAGSLKGSHCANAFSAALCKGMGDTARV